MPKINRPYCNGKYEFCQIAVLVWIYQCCPSVFTDVSSDHVNNKEKITTIVMIFLGCRTFLRRFGVTSVL